MDNKDDVVKLRKCFVGFWSLDDLEIIKKVIEKFELFVMKLQREGGGQNFVEVFQSFFIVFFFYILSLCFWIFLGNNIYGDDVRENKCCVYFIVEYIFKSVKCIFVV